MNLKEIGFKEKKEQWFSYKLSDETILKIKPILIKVIDEGKDFQGNPRFSLQTTNVIGISPSDSKNVDEFKRKEDNLTVEDLNKDIWNEYLLDNSIFLMLKPIIAQIDRTGTLDPMDLPIYNIQAQTLIKQRK